jgi:hypothetical protein
MIDDKTLFVHLLVISVFIQYSARTWNTSTLIASFEAGPNLHIIYASWT